MPHFYNSAKTSDPRDVEGPLAEVVPEAVVGETTPRPGPACTVDVWIDRAPKLKKMLSIYNFVV